MEGVNAMLEAADIAYAERADLSGTLSNATELDALEETPDGIARGYAGDLTAKSLHRVFNDGRWDHGGRLYGGHWEYAPKARRKLLTINGEPTAELDFKALHPRLLYGRLGLEMASDPYELEIGGQPVSRDLSKVTLNQYELMLAEDVVDSAQIDVTYEAIGDFQEVRDDILDTIVLPPH